MAIKFLGHSSDLVLIVQSSDYSTVFWHVLGWRKKRQIFSHILVESIFLYLWNNRMVCVCVCVCMSAFYLILFLGSHKYLGSCIFSNEIFFPTLLSVVFLIVSFSFTGTFILLTDSVYPQHVLSFLIVSSPHLYLQYWFSGDGWLFLLFQRVEVDKWFSNVHLSLSWLMLLLRIPPGFSKFFFFYPFVPKSAFMILCVFRIEN